MKKPDSNLFNLKHLGYADRQHLSEDRFLWFQRAQIQQTTMVRLATHDAVVKGDFEAAVHTITEAAAEALIVNRVGIWLMSEDQQELRSVDLFDRTTEKHSQPLIMRASEHPHYFRALERDRAVDVHDVENDPRTSEFKDKYLTPLGIKSLLGAAIRESGKVVGLVCFEFCGYKRTWLTDEKNFAGEIADLMALTLANCKRKQAEEALLIAHHELEERVQERTAKLQEEIVERKKAQAKERELQIQLHQSDKLHSIGLLSAGVAHELNSPLTGLLSLLRTYRKRATKDSVQYGEVTEMLEASEHMAKIIRDLNDFSKVSSEEHAVLDIHEVIEATLSFSVHELKRHQISIHKDYAENLPRIKGNKCQLQQVVLNFVTNARDAMKSGGVFTIQSSYDEQNGYVTVKFADCGVGIKHEHLSKIFDPFFTTKARIRGTGLGLSVSHGIIHSHHGEILVDSELGRGTTFILKLRPIALQNMTLMNSDNGADLLQKSLDNGIFSSVTDNLLKDSSIGGRFNE